MSSGWVGAQRLEFLAMQAPTMVELAKKLQVLSDTREDIVGIETSLVVLDHMPAALVTLTIEEPLTLPGEQRNWR